MDGGWGIHEEIGRSRDHEMRLALPAKSWVLLPGVMPTLKTSLETLCCFTGISMYRYMYKCM